MENLQQFLPIIVIFAAMYFLMIRPQQTRVKKEKESESKGITPDFVQLIEEEILGIRHREE